MRVGQPETEPFAIGGWHARTLLVLSIRDTLLSQGEPDPEQVSRCGYLPLT